jgi:endoglucanase
MCSIAGVSSNANADDAAACVYGVEDRILSVYDVPMKTTLYSLLVLITLITAALGMAQTSGLGVFTPNPSRFEIRRGVNLSHWLSQCFGWSPRDTFITEKDVQFIASLGYDHVRIPIDEQEMWTADGEPAQQAFSYLTRCLDWCIKHKLKAIVELHILRSHYFNAPHEGGKNVLWTSPAAQENFLRLWKMLSEKLETYPADMLAYEILNEPIADDHEDWNRLLDRAVAAIRSREPRRVLIIGSNMWQTPGTFPYLKVPKKDKNLILSVHTYAPLVFTHYKASWTPLKSYDGSVRYPGPPITDEDLKRYDDRNDPAVAPLLLDARVNYDQQRLQEVLDPAIRRAKELNLQLYCGEFGCLPSVAREDRLRYYSDLVYVLEANGIAWCNWDYKGDFGIVSYDRDKMKSLTPDFGLIGALLKTSRSTIPTLPKD